MVAGTQTLQDKGSLPRSMDPVTMLSKVVSQSRMTGIPSVGTWNLEQASGVNLSGRLLACGENETLIISENQ